MSDGEVQEIPPDTGDAATPPTPEEAEHSAEWAAMVAREPAADGGAPKTAVPVTGPQTVDWSAAPPAMQRAYEAEVHARKSAEGRVAATQRHLHELTASQQADPAARLQEIRDEYPDILDPIIEEALRPMQAEINQLRQSQEIIGEERFHAASAQQEALVREAHHDYDDITDSDDFVAWAHEQGGFLRQAIEANAEFVVNAEDTAMILDKYKGDRGITAGRAIRDIQLRASQGTPPSSAGAFVGERGSRRNETEADVWAELVRAEEHKERMAEAR